MNGCLIVWAAVLEYFCLWSVAYFFVFEVGQQRPHGPTLLLWKMCGPHEGNCARCCAGVVRVLCGHFPGLGPFRGFWGGPGCSACCPTTQNHKKKYIVFGVAGGELLLAPSVWRAGNQGVLVQLYERRVQIRTKVSDI